jgi:hypothetical protein
MDFLDIHVNLLPSPPSHTAEAPRVPEPPLKGPSWHKGPGSSSSPSMHFRADDDVMCGDAMRDSTVVTSVLCRRMYSTVCTVCSVWNNALLKVLSHTMVPFHTLVQYLFILYFSSSHSIIPHLEESRSRERSKPRATQPANLPVIGQPAPLEGIRGNASEHPISRWYFLCDLKSSSASEGKGRLSTVVV